MRRHDLRRRCRKLLRQLDVRPPLDVAQLCRQFGAERGREIRLLAHPIPVPGPFGVWIATNTVDYILYQSETTKSHQDHIILHELGHMLADHASDEQDDDLLRNLYPDLSPEAVRRALRRTSYDDTHEREAELVASIILEWATVINYTVPPSSRTGVDRQMRFALGDRQGWL